MIDKILIFENGVAQAGLKAKMLISFSQEFLDNRKIKYFLILNQKMLVRLSITQQLICTSNIKLSLYLNIA